MGSEAVRQSQLEAVAIENVMNSAAARVFYRSVDFLPAIYQPFSSLFPPTHAVLVDSEPVCSIFAYSVVEYNVPGRNRVHAA